MKTVLYYTSNREKPDFENKIRRTLQENCGGLPIISVSQLPVDLGKNICIGNKGASTLNMFRQILLGAQAAKTEYVIFAEADFLYPPEYFAFEPDGDFYRYDNVWLIFNKNKRNYRQIPWSNGAQVARRQFIIDTLTKYLDGEPDWSPSDKEYVPNKVDYNGAVAEWFSGPPAISFKTGDGLAAGACFIRESIKPVLDYWGSSIKVGRKYICS